MRDGDSRIVVDGPFSVTKELVAGFMILEVGDMDEAMAWVMRAPHCAAGRSEMEIRPLMGMAEFEAVQTPEARAVRNRIRAKLMGI